MQIHFNNFLVRPVIRLAFKNNFNWKKLFLTLKTYITFLRNGVKNAGPNILVILGLGQKEFIYTQSIDMYNMWTYLGRVFPVYYYESGNFSKRLTYMYLWSS